MSQTPRLAIIAHDGKKADLVAFATFNRDRLAEFMTFGTEVLAISTDPTYSLRVFADTDGLNFPLLSDFWPHGAVATAYGVFDAERGVASRSSFVIDKAGIIRWAVHNEMADERDLDEHVAQLHQLA